MLFCCIKYKTSLADNSSTWKRFVCFCLCLELMYLDGWKTGSTINKNQSALIPSFARNFNIDLNLYYSWCLMSLIIISTTYFVCYCVDLINVKECKVNAATKLVDESHDNYLEMGLSISITLLDQSKCYWKLLILCQFY